MSTREPLEWQYFKQLDHSVGMSFKNSFHFALVGHLIKGFRHPEAETINRTVRVLNMLLSIVSKPTKRDRFEVTPESIPYLAALLPVSEEVRSRCRLKHPSCGTLLTSDSVDSMDMEMQLFGHSPSSSLYYEDGQASRRQKSWEFVNQNQPAYPPANHARNAPAPSPNPAPAPAPSTQLQVQYSLFFQTVDR